MASVIRGDYVYYGPSAAGGTRVARSAMAERSDDSEPVDDWPGLAPLYRGGG